MRRLLPGAVIAVLLPAPRVLAYRTAADAPDYAGTPRVRWATDDLRYEISEALPRGIHQADLQRAAERAVATWSEPACTALSGRFEGTTPSAPVSGDGRTTIGFVNDWAERGLSADAAATTDVTYRLGDSGWSVVDADILIQAQGFTWTVSPSGEARTRDLQAVITHEWGHAGANLWHPCELDGMDGAPACATDSAFADATMYPLYVGESQRILGEDDRAGVCFMYPAEGCAVAGCPGGMACTADGCRPSCLGIVCAPDERCTPDGCAPVAPECPGSGCPGLEIGDPCSDHDDCATAFCAQGGYCTRDCTASGACDPGFSCAEAGDLRECRPGTAVFGASCARPSECLSGFCLAGAEPLPICTRACEARLAACPAGFTCDVVDGADVCRPRAGGCATGGSRPASRGSVVGCLVLFAFLFMRRRWRRPPRSP